jgi:hypothetical protein
MSVDSTKLAQIIHEAVEAKQHEAGHFTSIEVLCDCGRPANLGAGDPIPLLIDLVEHAMFDHATSSDILIEVKSRLLTAYEMRRALGYNAGTEAEEKWRLANPL